LTNILCAIVDKYGHISDAALCATAQHVGTTPVSLDAVVSHYHYLPRHATPRSALYICNCMHCKLHGADAVEKSLEVKGIPFHHASWLGWCVNGAPAAMVKNTGDPNIHALLNLKPDDERLEQFKKDSPPSTPLYSQPETGIGFNVLPATRLRAGAPSILQNYSIKDEHKHYFAEGRCPVSNVVWELPPEEIIARLKASGLRGCGGALSDSFQVEGRPRTAAGQNEVRRRQC
jgi:hypothetical protein